MSGQMQRKYQAYCGSLQLCNNCSKSIEFVRNRFIKHKSRTLYVVTLCKTKDKRLSGIKDIVKQSF